MAPKYFRTGSGTLTLGGTSGVDFSAQVTSCTVTPEAGDVITVLSGDTIGNYTANLAVNFLQDLTTAGITAYSFDNAGTTVDFEFVPNTALGAKIAGRVTIDPLPVGGATTEIAQSDVSWTCPELPTFTAATTPTG